MDQRPFYVRALLCLLGNISGIDQVPRKNQIIHIQIFCSSSPINDRRTRSSCGFGDSGVMWKSERCKIRFISCSFLLLCENTYNHTQIAITSWDTNWNSFYILYYIDDFSHIIRSWKAISLCVLSKVILHFPMYFIFLCSICACSKLFCLSNEG